MLQSTRASQGIACILLLGLLTLNGCDEEEPPGSETGGSSPIGSGGGGGDDSRGTGGDENTGASPAAGGSKGEATGGKEGSGGSMGGSSSGGNGECDPTEPDDACAPDRLELSPTGVLNDTGANYCRELGASEPIDCTGTGADGEFGRDVDYPSAADGFAGFSYAKVCHSGELAGTGNCPVDPNLGAGQNDWGCTLDNVTGLLWEIKTNDGGTRDVSRVYSHRGETSSWDVTSYVRQVNSQGLCGGDDWRLPHADELESLVVYNALLEPATDQQVQFDFDWFPNTIRTIQEEGFDDSYEAAYWILETGQTWQGHYFYTGWFIDFLAGSGREYDRNDEEALFSIRLVRGAASPYPTSTRFDASEDGSEVKDLTTGLSWKRCAEGQTWDGTTCLGFATTMTNDEAFALAALNSGWRVANAKELMSLFYIAGADDEGTLQLNDEVFPNSFGQLPHLTSTPVPWNPWYYYSIGTGRMPRDTSDAGIVRLVRQ